MSKIARYTVACQLRHLPTKALSSGAYKVMDALAFKHNEPDHPDKRYRDKCFVYVKDLATLTGLSRQTVNYHIRKLKDCGLIKSRQQKDRANQWYLRWNFDPKGFKAWVEEHSNVQLIAKESNVSDSRESNLSDSPLIKGHELKDNIVIDSVVSSGDSLCSPQSAGDSIPEESTRGNCKTSPVEDESLGGSEIKCNSISLVKVSEYEARMDREPRLEDLLVWRDRVFDYWLDSVLALKEANPIDWAVFAPFEKFDRPTVKRMLRNFSNRVLEDYEFSPLQAMEFLLGSIRWGDIPKGGHYPMFPEPGMFQKRIQHFSTVVHYARLRSHSLKASVPLEATAVERANYVLANLPLVMRETGLRMDDWGDVESAR